MLHRRHAFTFIELLVVIVIIGILMGLLFPALGLLKKAQRKTATLKLMNEVGLAITHYLAEYPMLGSSEAAFESDPWRFLHRDPVALGKPAYLNLTTRNLASGVPPAGPFAPAAEREATLILDAFTTSDHGNHLVFDVVNRVNAGREYTDSVRMTSTAGSKANAKDDLILQLDLATGRWDPVTP